MPIFGFTNGNSTDLDRMYSVLKHRGKDNFCQIQDENLHIGTARHNFDIVTKNSSGFFQNKSISVAMSGYIYNSENQEITPKKFAQLFINKQTNCLTELHGAFVGIIKFQNKIYLVRDGAGRRTIFYAFQNNRFYFSIEIKGILALNFERKINQKSVFQYFTFSFVPEKNTMMQDVFELKAGHYLCLSENNQLEEKRYFKFEENPKHHQNDSEYWQNRIRQDFDAEINRILARTKDVGVYLSGGLDSSIIVAMLAKRIPNLKTYTIHFGEKYLNELEFADLVAKKYQTDHREVLIRPKNFIPNLRQTIWHLDDPVGDPITVPNFELAKVASQDVNVIFNGEGGDPCFGGPKNIPMMLLHWYGNTPEKNFREKAYLESYRRGYSYRNQLFTNNFLNQIDEENDLEKILTPYFQTDLPADFLDKLMAINIRLKGAHLILPKVERMLGAWGLNSISPMFTDDVVRSSMEMSTDIKLQNAIEKYILKMAFENDVPPKIIARPKSGMRVPVHYWFKGEMKRYAKKMLSPKNLHQTDFFDVKTVQKILKYDTEEGIRRHGLLIWMLLTFEIWRKIFIENEAV